MKKIAIINYGVGNLRSVQHAFHAIGLAPELVVHPELLNKYDRIVLPGVGAFDPAIKNLRTSGFDVALKKYVQDNKGKILGLCLGMQLLLEQSEEGKECGLGIIKGNVRSLSGIAGNLNIPHMGWNNVKQPNAQNSGLLAGINDPCFYFVHSYYCKPEGDLVTYTTNYGQDFVSAFETKNIMACQFHPEKSHDAGLLVLKNFSEW